MGTISWHRRFKLLSCINVLPPLSYKNLMRYDALVPREC